MKMHSLIVASALAVGLALPAMAQSNTMHRYAQFFKYSDSAVKAMTDNPQDRSAAVAKLFEGFGGKVEASYWFPGNFEWDGMLIVQLPDEITGQAIALTTRATGNFTRNKRIRATDECGGVQGGNGQGKERQIWLYRPPATK